MSETKEKQDLSKRGFWYEQRDGKIYLCFRVRIDQQKFIKKCELPVGVRELNVKTVPA